MATITKLLTENSQIKTKHIEVQVIVQGRLEAARNKQINDNKREPIECRNMRMFNVLNSFNDMKSTKT